MRRGGKQTLTLETIMERNEIKFGGVGRVE